jgi:hypothetical protein
MHPAHLRRRYGFPRAIVPVAAIALSALLAGNGPSPAFAQACPTNDMQFRGLGAFTSTAPAKDTTLSLYPDYRVAYDLVAGTLALRHCCALGQTYVRALDTYDVNGVAPGTPVALTVELAVDSRVWDGGSCGGSGCSGTFGVDLQHGAVLDERVHSPNLFGGAQALYHDVLSIPVTIVAGQPEQILYKLWGFRPAGGSHGAEGTAAIRFLALQPGISVVSCQGFGGQVVPVRTSSWGSLKVRYR